MKKSEALLGVPVVVTPPPSHPPTHPLFFSFFFTRTHTFHVVRSMVAFAISDSYQGVLLRLQWRLQCAAR
jgi:hypothetical protein